MFCNAYGINKGSLIKRNRYYIQKNTILDRYVSTYTILSLARDIWTVFSILHISFSHHICHNISNESLRNENSCSFTFTLIHTTHLYK